MVDGVRIGPNHASYRDLVVDAWVPAGGDLRLEDEDELAELVEAGGVTDELRERIDRAARQLLSGYRRVTAEVEAAIEPFLPRA